MKTYKTATICFAGAAALLFGCASNPPPAPTTAASAAPPPASAAGKPADTVAAGSTSSQADTKPVSPPVTYIPKDKVATALGIKGGPPIYAQENFRVIASRREDAKKPAEVHSKDADIFYIIDGTATFVTGGELVDGAPTDPDEIRGPSIKGGEPHHLQKGDVVIIPRGTPHHFTEVKGAFDYLVVKVRL